MAINCCKDCQLRHRGCHSKCPTYISQQAEHRAAQEWLRAEAEKDYFAMAVAQNGRQYEVNRRKKKHLAERQFQLGASEK